MNRVAKQFADHGPGGHHGQDVQKHVVEGKDHVIVPLLGTMGSKSSKKKQKSVIQVIFDHFLRKYV